MEVAVPNHREDIESGWQKILPGISTIRNFRDKAGFHADKPAAFLAARYELMKSAEAADAFLQLCILTLKSEREELPDLQEVLDGLLDEVDERYPDQLTNRESLRSYLAMLGS